MVKLVAVYPQVVLERETWVTASETDRREELGKTFLKLSISETEKKKQTFKWKKSINLNYFTLHLFWSENNKELNIENKVSNRR